MTDPATELNNLVKHFIGNILFLHYSHVTPGLFSDFNDRWLKLLSLDLGKVKDLPVAWLESLREELAAKGLMPKWDELESRIYGAIDRSLGEVGRPVSERIRIGRD